MTYHFSDTSLCDTCFTDPDAGADASWPDTFETAMKVARASEAGDYCFFCNSEFDNGAWEVQ